MKMDNNQIVKLIIASGRSVSPRMKVTEDTTQFIDLDQGDVMILGENPYRISRNEKEVGFGQDDEPKYWVKRATNLTTGDTTIVKLVFFEEFTQEFSWRYLTTRR